jgi:glutamyl/glutaminyl-tRNA synthetase
VSEAPSPIAAALARVPPGARTRFAPAPTGFLHRGHLVNAVLVWGIARAVGGTVVLRVEDHDRQRSRRQFEAALLDDLERLGLVPDEPTLAELRVGSSLYRQSDHPERYEDAMRRLGQQGLVYACVCARSDFAAWASVHGRAWQGAGCPRDCAARGLPLDAHLGLRVALGGGEEAWEDLLLGERSGDPSATGDLLVRDRSGNSTYAFCVVVDDLSHRINLVIRGADLLDATPAQLRLARLLAGGHPARFLHHPLVRHPSGTKLSKADGATALREALDAGEEPGRLLAEAARAAGVPGVPSRLEAAALGAVLAAVRRRTGTGHVAPDGRDGLGPAAVQGPRRPGSPRCSSRGC